jgi:hypothetical protein
MTDTTIPSVVLGAVGRAAGGQVALVLGAGCSVESPTDLPPSEDLSRDAHRRLILDGVLEEGDCADPGDLSCVADAVYTRTGRQREMVEVLPRERFRFAKPNDGTLIAAALLLDGVVRYAMLLNYDRSLQNALSELGAGEDVRVIRGPEDQANLGATNLIFIHRSVDADPETWVLRSASLESDWRDGWEQIVAQIVLPTPVILFAGLGTPVGVLLETVERIKQALPAGAEAVVADPGRRAESVYAEKLGIGDDRYVRLGWSALMRRLGTRRVAEHKAALEAACNTLINEEGRPSEDVACLCRRAAELGLVRLGRLRAEWLLSSRPYLADAPVRPEHIGDLLLAVGTLERSLGATAKLREDGLVDLWIEDRRVASVCLGSGQGYRGLTSVQERMRARDRPERPTFGVAAGYVGAVVATTPPGDVVRGDPAAGYILSGSSVFSIVAADDLRSDMTLAASLVDTA